MEEVKPSRHDVISQFRTREIIDAAIKLINEEGFSKVTMEGVASRAGIAKGTIYLYFKDKDELTHTVIDSVLGMMVDDVSSCAAGEIDTREKLLRVAEVINRYAKDYWEFFVAVHYPDFVEKYHKCEDFQPKARRLVSVVADILREGVERGDVVNLNPELVATVFLNIFQTVYQAGIAQHTRASTVNSSLLIDLLFNGISRARDSER
jgi:AcrR family transcriptional regulator